MAYQKLLIDNLTCSRRFHITFDDENKPVGQAKAQCPFCGVTIFSEANHPAVTLARQENLVKTAALSPNTVNTCEFKDEFSRKTQKS